MFGVTAEKRAANANARKREHKIDTAMLFQELSCALFECFKISDVELRLGNFGTEVFTMLSHCTKQLGVLIVQP